jgi:two-component system, OmpR family, response regulator
VALITYLVEDNQTILDNLIATLEEIASVKVVGHAATESEAKRWLTLHDGYWQLAVVDMFLQEGSGLGVLAGCRQREPYQKVVVLTNYATADIRRRSMALGADAVFDKSNELDEFFAYCIAETAKPHPIPDDSAPVPVAN